MNKVGLFLSPKHSGNGQAVTHSAAGLAAGSPLVHSQGTLPQLPSLKAREVATQTSICPVIHAEAAWWLPSECHSKWALALLAHV